jgi:hypothetical protein
VLDAGVDDLVRLAIVGPSAVESLNESAGISLGGLKGGDVMMK